ncbi:hypothetical protein MT418_000619 [Batrachochytrium dendrobatidis]
MAEEDADSLFRRHGVGELKVLLEKIKTDADRKKYDLRIMVGERYRDVIGTADAILLMRESAQQMGDLFEQTDRLCDVATLKKQTLLKTSASGNLAAEDRKALIFSVAAQIRLLVITPDQIWTSLEQHQYLAAGRLYLISRLVFRGLQTGRQAALLKIPSSFPVVQRQWDAISPFRAQIIEKIKHRLLNSSLEDQHILETLGAIAMLDNLSPKGTLDVLLAQRIATVESILSSNCQTVSTDTICSLLVESIDAIHKTLQSINKLFIQPVTALTDETTTISSIELFLHQLQKRSSHSTAYSPSTPVAPPHLTLTVQSEQHQCLVSSLYSEKTNMHLLFRHLPESIQRFSPVMNLGSNHIPLNNTDIQASVLAWLEQITRLVQSAGKLILGSILSGHTLADIRSTILKHIYSIEFQSLPSDNPVSILTDNTRHISWSELTVRVLRSKSYSLWNDIFQKLFLDQSIVLISTAFKSITSQPKTLLQQALDNLDKGGHTDRDVASFVWNSNLVDLNERSISYDNLRAVCRMQTPTMKSLGEAFEEAASVACKDLLPLIDFRTPSCHSVLNQHGSPYFPTETLDINADIFHCKKNAEILSTALRDSFFEAVKTYKDGMLAQLTDISSHMHEDEMAEYVLGIDQSLFIGRTARIIALKAGKFMAEFDSNSQFNSEKRMTDGSSVQSTAHHFLSRHLEQQSESRTLLPIQELLMDVYNQAHTFWTTSVALRLEIAFRDSLETQDWKLGKQFQTLWESMTIHAQGETGDAMESKMCLPVHASPFVLNILWNVCAELNRTGSYTLEKPCLRFLLLELSNRIIQVYSTFVTSEAHVERISEKGAFQLLFDFLLLVKFMEGSWKADTPRKTSIFSHNADEKDPLTLQFPSSHSHEQESQSVIAAIKQKIDPIDLAILEVQISSNVERFYSRTSVFLGSLLLLNPKPLETKRTPSVQEQHNLVPVAPPSPRFALLPVAGAVHSRSTGSRHRLSAESAQPSIDSGASSRALDGSSTQAESTNVSGVSNNAGSSKLNGTSHLQRKARPKATVRLSKTLASISSSEKSPSLVSSIYNSQAGSSSGSGGRVMGLVNAVAENITLSSSHQQKATELLMNASSFISGVWGTSSPLTTKTTNGVSGSGGIHKRFTNK